MIKIQEKEHSDFSPSSLVRRIECPPSLLLEKLCNDKAGYAAAEGTAAHYVNEKVLGGDLVSVIDETIKVGEHEVPVDEEMVDHAMDYMKYIAKCCKGLTNCRVFHELKLTLPGNDGRVYGYTDTLILSDTEIHVIDYKYGQVDVSPKGNKQLMGYSLGAIFETSKDFNTKNHDYYGHIVQPRGRFTPGAASCKYELEELQELRVQIDNTVKQIDNLDIEKGISGYCKNGDHCHYCKAIGICPIMHEAMLTVAIHSSGKDMSDDSQLFAFLHTEQIMKYLKKCKENLTYKATGGEQFCGAKVVRGIKHRHWNKDTDVILKELTGVYGLSASDISDVKIKAIGDVKKLVGAKDYKEIEKNLTTKPVGELTIAPLADRRKAVELELDDFKDE